MKTYRSTGVGVRSLFFGLAVVCAVALLSLSAAPAWGQAVSTGTVVGQILDPSGASVAGATVTLTDKSTGASRIATTEAAGRYTFTEVPPSAYDITVAKEGFSQAKVVNQQVVIGQQLTINVNLKVGSASQTVEVTISVGAELQTMNATVGDTMSGDSILLLPNFGRDTSTLATLQPATNPTGEVAGAIMDQNTYQLDGVNNSNDMDGTMNIYTPSYASNGAPTGVMPTPVESIEQFKVNTNNQTADFNGSAGGQVMMVTRKGNNQYHGTLYEYYQDSNFGGANTFDNNRFSEPISSNHENRFGGNFGGAILPKFWGGKTYLFAEYDGRRFPNASVYETDVPSALLRAGIVQTTGGGIYNLNPTAVTVNGTTYQPAVCPAGACDPRGIGLNPTISSIWSKYEPLPNDLAGGDALNVQGYRSNLLTPQKDNFGVVRLDHDFGEKWHFMAGYHYYHFYTITDSQVDIGGFFPGDTLGQAAAVSSRPQVPDLMLAALTTNITSNITNDVHVSYLRNFWQWVDDGIPPQLAGLGDTLEPGGETSTGVTVPYNVNNQNTRTRFWDGQDKALRDDVSVLHGNHLFSFGASYERNYLQHQRNDNGGTIQDSPFPVAILSNASTTADDLSAYTPSSVPNSDLTQYRKYYDEVLGIVTQTQELYPRVGAQLTLQPAGTPALEQSIVPTYNEYISDSWHIKPSFTLTYGLGYQIEMPPYELNGKQSVLVDADNNPISVEQYLSETYRDAIAGQIYNPVIGFSTVKNVAGNSIATGEKYPYNPFYKGFSPRISAAWNPSFDSGFLGHAVGHGKTVIRGGYSRIYGRLNGVDLVLVPLLAPGNLQATSCQGPQINGTCGGATPVDAFRIGVDGNTAPLGPAPSTDLPQPFFPGVNGAPNAGAGESLDPNFRPSQSDEFDLTIQRELPGKMLLEVGYIGRRLTHEYQPIDIAAVPYMLTEGGQQFQNAWANLYTELAANQPVTPQPFFEAALGGTGSAYCHGFSSCTAAVAYNENTVNGNIVGTSAVYDVWQDLSPSFVFGRSMASSPNCENTLVPSINSTTPVPVCQQVNSIGVNTSSGYGNYNGVFVSWRSNDFHGLTALSNLTYARALGTQGEVQATSEFTVEEPWNIHNGYGPQPFDYKFNYNLAMVYAPRIFKGQHSLAARMLGGWTIAPLFTAQSGAPLEVNTFQGAGADCESFGEGDCNFESTNENAVFTSSAAISTARGAGNSVQNIGNVTNALGVAANGNPTNGGSGLNQFANPNAVYNAFRAPILGIDNNTGGQGVLRGLPSWNLDASISKNFQVTERFSVMFIFESTNILNHVEFNNPFLALGDPGDFGVLDGAGGGQSNSPRSMQFGLRLHF